MNLIRKGLPSFFTSLGLISGCISIVVAVSYGNLTMAGIFIIIAAFFDFIDGMAARVLNSSSAFGVQLDSLADAVSFGVAPSMIMYQLLLLSYVGSSPGADFDVFRPTASESVVLFSSFLIAVFSALRLAKFNLDPEQVKNFKGLATPANALFIAALGFIAETSREIPSSGIVFNHFFLLAVIIISCYLLVCNLSMFSLKFSSFAIRKNIMRYVFIAGTILLISIYGLPGLAPTVVLYIILSMINHWFVKME
jgi:CDP-diacylglycerol--serine O-phosphatidyltransferase